MSRSTIGSARPLARHAALLIAAAALLTGCSAGQVAETANKIPSVPGVNTGVGDIAIRNALVVFPEKGAEYKAGEDASLEIALGNNGPTSDTLIQVSSEGAGRVELRAGSDAPTPDPSATPAPDRCVPPESPSASASPSGSASPSVSPSVSASPTPSEEPSADGLAPTNIELKPGCLVTLNATSQELVLIDLTKALRPGDLVPVTLRFEKAGSIVLNLPIGPPTEPLPRVSPTGEVEGGH